MRRHAPRDSPNWTRESGPMDAMIRDPLLASARTMTQLFATEFTQRDDVRDLDGTGVGGFMAGVSSGFDAATDGGAACARTGSGCATIAASGDRTLSRSMLPELTVVTRDATGSTGATAGVDGTVSAGTGAVSDVKTAAVRVSARAFGRLSRMSHAAINGWQ